MGSTVQTVYRTQPQNKQFYRMIPTLLFLLSNILTYVQSAPQSGYGGWGYNPGNNNYGNSIYSDGQGGNGNNGGNSGSRPDYNGNGSNGFYVDDNAFGNSIFNDGQGGHNNFGGNSGSRHDYNGNGNFGGNRRNADNIHFVDDLDHGSNNYGYNRNANIQRRHQSSSSSSGGISQRSASSWSS